MDHFLICSSRSIISGLLFCRLWSCPLFCDEKLEYLPQDGNTVIYLGGYCVNLQTDTSSSSGWYPSVSSSSNTGLVIVWLNQFQVVVSNGSAKSICAPYRGWTWAGEKRVTCIRMFRRPPFFSPKSREKLYLEILSRFGLWRDFLNNNNNNNNNNNIQATISVFRLVKNMSINAKSVEFHQCHGKPHSISFFYRNIKDNERTLCQDSLAIESTNSDLKVHALHYANELPVRVRLSFQKLL